jgi:predicted NAD-dependent protein-ADP-ribosyltransferase YbiA (DUF1768 family)
MKLYYIMVKSKINRKIVYEEIKDIESGDIDHETSVYQVNIIKFHARVNIILGKMNDVYDEEFVLFFNIYLLNNDDKIQYKIGIFELKVKDYDAFKLSGDIEKIGKILWFADLNERDLLNVSINYESDKSDDVDSDSIASSFGKKISSFRKIELEQEDKETANHIRKEFTSSRDTHAWIQEFMKNANYDIIDNEGNGDCFFCVLRDALKYVGIDISILTMRNLLAKEVDESVYLNYREHYDMYLLSIGNDKKRIKELNKKYSALEKETINLSDKKKKIKNMKIMESIKEEHDRVKNEMKVSEELLEDFIYMSDITSIVDFKKFVLTNNYWADTWVISKIERILNIKCILMSSDAYESGDKDNVIHCNQLGDEELIKSGEFNPDYYIIMDYNGNHYQLIRYNRKGIFNFHEIPYDLTNLIVYKCLEGDIGPYNIIPDFNKLKSQKSSEKRKYEVDLDNIYSSTTVFQIYNKSGDKLPGKGVGETIIQSDVSKYANLKKKKNWRRKLSHMWPIEIEIDGNTFQSIEHYMEGNKFINYPDLFKQFTLESNSTLSRHPEKAILMGAENSTIRDKKYKINPSYSGNKSELMDKALRQKFLKNDEFKKILKETNNAKIMEYRRAKYPRVMDELMKLRQELLK